MAERRYDEDEFALILKKASDSAESRPEASRATTALVDLRRIAAEANIEPAFVDEALARVQMERPGLWERIIRTPSKFFEERRFGWSLPKHGQARLIAALRRVVGLQGTVEDVLEGVEWTSRSSSGASMNARIQTRDGETRIEVFRNLTSLSGMTVGFAGPFFGVMFGLALSAALSLGLGLASAATITGAALTGAGIMWAWYRRVARRSRTLLDRVMAEMTAEMRSLARSEAPLSLPPVDADRDDGERPAEE